MPRTAVVQSDASMTRRTLKDAGFDDDQAQALIDLSGTAAERRALKADVVELKQNVVNLRTEMQGGFARLDARVDGLRDEMTARFEGLEGRMDARFVGMDARFESMDAKFEGLEGRMDARFVGMDAKFDGLEGRMDARFEGMEGRMKFMMWMMGTGLTFYMGTTVALMVLLYRSLLV